MTNGEHRPDFTGRHQPLPRPTPGCCVSSGGKEQVLNGDAGPDAEPPCLPKEPALPSPGQCLGKRGREQTQARVAGGTSRWCEREKSGCSPHPSHLMATEGDLLCSGEARRKVLGFLFQGLTSGTHLCLLWQYVYCPLNRCLCPVAYPCPLPPASILSLTSLPLPRVPATPGPGP